MSTSTPNTQPTRDHLFSDKQYFLLDSLAQIVLPALGTLYFALAQIWGLPSGEQVVGTIVAVDAFLGVILKVGEMSYNQSATRFAGAINVAEQPDKTVYSLDLNHDPAELKHMDTVTFKVNKPKESVQPAFKVPFSTPSQ